MVWTAPHTSCILSFEERRPSSSPADIAEYVRKGLPAVSAKDQYNFFVHSWESPDVQHESNGAKPMPSVEANWFEVAAHQATVVSEARPMPDAWIAVGQLLVRKHYTSPTNLFVPEGDILGLQPSSELLPQSHFLLGEEGKRNVLVDVWTTGDPASKLFE